MNVSDIFSVFYIKKTLICKRSTFLSHFVMNILHFDTKNYKSVTVRRLVLSRKALTIYSTTNIILDIESIMTKKPVKMMFLKHKT